MTRIRLPKDAKLCPHRTRALGPMPVHPKWHASDGVYGVCQMSPQHLKNAIHMMIETLRELSSFEFDEPNPREFDIWDAEDRLEMLLKERNRRIKEGRSPLPLGVVTLRKCFFCNKEEGFEHQHANHTFITKEQFEDDTVQFSVDTEAHWYHPNNEVEQEGLHPMWNDDTEEFS